MIFNNAFTLFYILLLITLQSYCHSFVTLARFQNTKSIQPLINKGVLNARTRRGQDETNEPKFTHGVDIPEEVLQHKSIYDMILIERINAPLKTSGGLLLPVIEGKDQKKLGIVVSMASEYGLESEQGRVQSMEEVAPYKVGDRVYVRDPWGIGPKDITVGERCFSFIKADHVLGVLTESK